MSTSAPKGPLVLLGLMTLFTFAGPVVLLVVLRGGHNANWPPDRPVEWWAFGLITGGVTVLMIACLSLGALSRKKETRESKRKAEQS